MKRTIFSTVLLLSAVPALARERLVPSQYVNVQAAVSDCVDGDVVIISPGTYRGSGNRDIDFGGKAIIVRSIDPNNFRVVARTIIDCEIAGRGFIFCTGENANSAVSGLTIINGHSLTGGAIYCSSNSSPTLSNCIIMSSSAALGGGLAFGGGSRATITNCTISSNSASMSGGAVYSRASSPTINNCVFNNNIAPIGGAIGCAVSKMMVRNCSLNRNSASKGGAIYCYDSSNVTIENSILWADAAENASQILVGNSGSASSLTVSYCDVQGGRSAAIIEQDCILNWGEHNFDVEPKFVAGPLGDYYLAPNSPCVDAGSDLAANLGYDELSTQADGLGESGIIDVGYHYPVEKGTVFVSVDIEPDVLDVGGGAQWLSCRIELPEDHNAGDVDSDSILLEYTVDAEKVWADKRRQVLMVDFSRSKLQDRTEQGEVELAVSGRFADGSVFEGTDLIWVIRRTGQ
ncbi:MAG: right-handed parallel beta-helix repeat-containing protein [Planctomycetota bacterium]